MRQVVKLTKNPNLEYNSFTMGNSESTAQNHHQEHLKFFTDSQLNHLHELHAQLTNYSQTNDTSSLTSWSFPLEWIPYLIDWMFHSENNHSKDGSKQSSFQGAHGKNKKQSIRFSTLAFAAHTLVQVKFDELETFISFFVSKNVRIKDFLRPLAISYFRILRHTTPVSTQFDVEDDPSRLLEYLSTKPPDQDALLLLELEGNQDSNSAFVRKEFSLSDFHDWFSQSLYIQTIWKSVMYHAFLETNPKLTVSKRPDWYFASRILTISDFFLLDNALDPVKFKKRTWRLLFSSDTYGKSWTVFRERIEDAENSFLVVRDTDGHVFGGFASRPWDPQPNFYGDSDCFVFSLTPFNRLYRPTGVNTNYMYYNHGTQTFPNGIGFGGQFDFFGLWIQDDFAHGHSLARPTSSTFGNTILSKKECFTIDSIEVWQIAPRIVDERLVSKKTSRSILDGPESTILEMAGKTLYSKQVREADPLAEEDEDLSRQL